MAITLCALTLLLSAAPEKQVKFETLPEVVRTKVHEKYPQAKVVGAEAETNRDGKTVYEVKLSLAAGAKTEISFTAEGVLVSEERVVAWKSVPAEIQKALATSPVKDLKIERVEEVTEGETVTWEIVGKGADGKRLEVVIDRKGTVEVKAATE